MSKDANPLLTHLLPEGTRIRCLREESDCDENDERRTAPPGSLGTIDRVMQAQVDCYSVVFDCGVWGLWTQDEMAQQAEVVLRGAHKHEREAGHYWAVDRSGPNDKAVVAEWDGDSWYWPGSEMPWAYADVLVLSERLSPPTTHSLKGTPSCA